MNIQQRAQALLDDSDFQDATLRAASQLDNDGLPFDLHAVVRLASGDTDVASDGDDAFLEDVERRLSRHVAITRLAEAGLFYSDTMPTYREAHNVVRSAVGLSDTSRLRIPIGDPAEIIEQYGYGSVFSRGAEEE